MELRSIFKLSIKNLRTNRVRSLLTMLGLIIGIGSVILVTSVGAGAQTLILSQVNSLGSTLVGVLPGASDTKGPPAAVFGIQVRTLINDDIKALKNDDRTHHIIDVAGYARGNAKIAYDNREINGAAFMGVSATYPNIENVTLKRGRFFTSDEDGGLARVVILGSDIAQELFDDDDPLGKSIKIKRESFKIIGEFESRGTVAFTNQDKQVFIPLLTAQRVMLGQRHLSLIRARVDDASNIDETLQGMRKVLREQHNLDTAAEDDFSVRSSAQALDLLHTITNAFAFFLSGIAALSLLVGGIGIMNIMLVAVTERFKEIGLRKAVGAKASDILKQFLLETLLITGMAALIGIISGSLFSALIALIAKNLGYDWAYIVSPYSILTAVLTGGAVGLIFGLYPAKKAAGLEPVEALRYE